MRHMLTAIASCQTKKFIFLGVRLITGCPINAPTNPNPPTKYVATVGDNGKPGMFLMSVFEYMLIAFNPVF